MPGINYWNPQQTTYTGIDPKTGQLRTEDIPGRSSATSPGPYGLGSPLGNATQVTSFNLNNAGNLTQLTDLINNLNLNAQNKSNLNRIPDAANLETKSSADINAELSGTLPQDVLNLLGEQAAERGVATGTVGSPNANAAYLRALGLTSLGLEQVGQQNLTAAYGRNPGARIFDPSTQLITPYQGTGLGGALPPGSGNPFAPNARFTNPFNNPGYGGGGGGAPIPGPTGADLFGPDYSLVTPGGGDGAPGQFGSSYGYNPDVSNWYDYNAPSNFPGDYGTPSSIMGSPDYASTPLSMYG